MMMKTYFLKIKIETVLMNIVKNVNSDEHVNGYKLCRGDLKSCFMKSRKSLFPEIYVGNTIEITWPSARSSVLNCIRTNTIFEKLKKNSNATWLMMSTVYIVYMIRLDVYSRVASCASLGRPAELHPHVSPRCSGTLLRVSEMSVQNK